MEPSFVWRGLRREGLAVVLPGIQSYAAGQALGLRPVLVGLHVRTVGYDYSTGDFKPEQLAAAIADSVRTEYAQLDGGGKITLVGLSLGASLAVLVARNLQQQGLVAEIIMIDPPFGADTMKAAPNWLAPVAHWVLAALALLTPSAFSFGKAATPSDEQLWLPNEADRQLIFGVNTEDDYRRLARQADLDNQVGHSFRTWFAQMAWLTGDATKVELGDLQGSLSYIMADSSHNTVVRSTLAHSRWSRLALGRLRMVQVDAEHCATLRHQPEYAWALRILLK